MKRKLLSHLVKEVINEACWKGYEQIGMKDKGGRKVPNCVPIKKSIFGSEGPQDLIPKNK